MNFMEFQFTLSRKKNSVKIENRNEDKKNQTNTWTVIRNALQIFYKYQNQV